MDEELALARLAYLTRSTGAGQAVDVSYSLFAGLPGSGVSRQRLPPL